MPLSLDPRRNRRQHKSPPYRIGAVDHRPWGTGDIIHEFNALQGGWPTHRSDRSLLLEIVAKRELLQRGRLRHVVGRLVEITTEREVLQRSRPAHAVYGAVEKLAECECG